MAPLFDALVANYSTNGDADWGSTMYGKVLVSSQAQREDDAVQRVVSGVGLPQGRRGTSCSCGGACARPNGGSASSICASERDTPCQCTDPMWREFFVHEGVKAQRTTQGSSTSSSDASCIHADRRHAGIPE